MTTAPQYDRATYTLERYELVAPAVRNDGTPSGYPDAVADALDAAGFNWSAFDSIGSWMGQREAGRTFVIYAPDGIAAKLGRIGRNAMPDQDAIQVCQSTTPTTLTEA